MDSLNKPDPEMLANLDLLLNMDVAENEDDWDTVADLEDAGHAEATEGDKHETP
jgi:hypothetical protein